MTKAPKHRRDFIILLGGAAVAWPLAAGAQQPERMRRIGILLAAAADDPEYQTRLAASYQGLALSGWTIGRNVRIETRWAGANANNIRRHAAELVALAPDVIMAFSGLALGAVLEATRTVPIVFTSAVDPVGGGQVASLAHPGGNATGFLAMEYGMAVKWLELLKQIAPHVRRAAVIRNATGTTGAGLAQFGAIQGVASSFGVELSPVDTREAEAIDRSIAAFARGQNDGLIVTSSAQATTRRDLIVALAARHRLPAVYSNRAYVAVGGLISYAADQIDQYRKAAGYVDRILKGEKPADLPVQAPTKYETVLNMKTAKALGLDIPPIVLVRADEVIE